MPWYFKLFRADKYKERRTVTGFGYHRNRALLRTIRLTKKEITGKNEEEKTPQPQLNIAEKLESC